MSTKRSCYQCGDDDIEAIKAKRNEEIRAYGRKVLADADAAFFAEKNVVVPVSDWDVVDVVVPEPEPEPEPVEEAVTPEPPADKPAKVPVKGKAATSKE